METSIFNVIFGFEFLVPFALVLLGAGFQVATGIGLGLIAAPGLLFLLNGPTAVQVAILLNLALTVMLIRSEWELVDFSQVKQLSIWALLGIPFGIALLFVLSGGWLKVVSGAVVILAAMQLYTSKTQFTKSMSRHIGMAGGGFGSGVMTGALGMPGPIALWTLLNTQMVADTIRASMRAYFLVAYSAALLLHLAFNGWILEVAYVTLALTPALVLGIVAGGHARRGLSGELLRGLLEKLLVLMGGVLFIKGVWDVV